MRLFAAFLAVCAFTTIGFKATAKAEGKHHPPVCAPPGWCGHVIVPCTECPVN